MPNHRSPGRSAVYVIAAVLFGIVAALWGYLNGVHIGDALF